MNTKSLVLYAGLTPETIAVKDESNSLTYRELLEKITSMAGAIAKISQPDEVITVVADNSPNALAMIYAVMASGRVALPVATFLPKPVVDISMATVGSTLTIGIGTEYDPDDDYSSYTYECTWDGGLALGSSGTSTGQQMIALNTYAGLTTSFSPDSMLEGMAQPDVLTAGLVANSSGIIGSMYAFCNGSTLHLMNSRFNPEAFAQRVNDDNIAAISIMPFVLQSLLASNITSESLPNLKTIVSGSAEFTQSLQAKALAAFPGVKIFDVLSSTETGLLAINDINSVKSDKGYIHESVTIKFLDHDGGSGEIYAKGPGVMAGVYSDGRLLRVSEFVTAGDYGYVEDGKLYITGRRADKLKMKGYTIYTGQIESCLQACLGIEDVAVIGDDEQQLVAFYVGPVSQEEVAKYAKANLPGYMVPSKIRKIEELPKSIIGKTLKRKINV
jgi:acyl-CoA synthetase (AMP-forming)/AMP-acid ligase II